MSLTFYLFFALYLYSLFKISKTPKTRTENGDWNQKLQWRYIFTFLCAFLTLSSQFSFNDTIFLFVIFFFVLMVAHQNNKRKSEDRVDNNSLTDFGSSLFLFVFVIWLVRSFILEPFQIPSSSMRPGLIPGDFILVDKNTYGFRLPLSNKVFIERGKVERNDVVVFSYPLDTKTAFIKRVVGLPGDEIEYKLKDGEKILSVNKQDLIYTPVTTNYEYIETDGRDVKAKILKESASGSGSNRMILQTIDTPLLYLDFLEKDFPHKENCQYQENSVKCVIPQGHYFLMGDNRDNSHDSRYWGFVSDEMILGKAVRILVNFKQLDRVWTPIY